MKQSIQLRLGQSLVMTPQLQQAIRLLQLSTAELNAEVQEALDSNMMLEIDEEQDLGRGTGAQNGEEADRPAREAEPNADLKVTDENLAGDIPEELPVDSAWADVFDTPVGASEQKRTRTASTSSARTSSARVSSSGTGPTKSRAGFQ